MCSLYTDRITQYTLPYHISDVPVLISLGECICNEIRTAVYNMTIGCN